MANRFPLIFNSGAGQIQELAASDNLDLTSSNLVNAGILFTSSGSATAPSLQIGSGTTYNPGLYSPGTDQLAISTSGTGRLFVDASGRVAVNSSPGTSILKVQQLVDDTTGGLQLISVDGNGAIISRLNDGGLTFRNGGSERLRITSAGLVGIGTSSPGGLFHVSGGRTLLSSSDGYELAFARTGNYFYLYNDGGNLTGKLSLTTTSGAGGGEIITFTQDTKRVGIGTTSPTAQLTSTSTIQVTGFANPTGGTGLELGHDGTNGIVQSFNRATSAYKDLLLSGNSIQLSIAGGEAARIDSSRRLLVGTSTSLDQNAQLQVAGTGYFGFNYFNFSNDAFAPTFSLKKSRGATVGTNTIVQSGDTVGTVSFFGANGTGFDIAARIDAVIDGTPGASSNMPGRLVFSTTPNGGSSPTSSPPAMTIKSSQEVLIGTSTITANGGILQLKSGITFPATAVAASDANTLDDYEEGDWTPTWSVTTGSITANSSTSGKYTKIGRTVFIVGYISYQSNSSASGTVEVAGLPFTAGAGFGQSNNRSGGVYTIGNGFFTSNSPNFANIPAGNTKIQPIISTSTGSTALTFADFNTGSANYDQFVFAGQYNI